MGPIKGKIAAAKNAMVELNYQDPEGKKLAFAFAGFMTVVALAAISAGVLHHYNQFPMPCNPMMEKMLIGGGVSVLGVEAIVVGFFKWSQPKVGSEVESIVKAAQGGSDTFAVQEGLHLVVKAALKEMGYVVEVGSRFEGIGDRGTVMMRSLNVSKKATAEDVK